nr:PIG-L deacetylase family protein [Salicibibacter halophilus]
MDDETIGMGGTIASYAKNGISVSCVQMTDGANSVSNLSTTALSKTRKEEMRQVKDCLGIEAVYHLDLPDGDLHASDASIRLLATIIEHTAPEIIYTTPYIDAHPDHTNTAFLLAETLRQMKVPSSLKVRLYEINCPIPPEEINVIVDISSFMEEKKEAINTFASQTIAFDGFLALNTWKSHLVDDPKVTHAEVFKEMGNQEFQEMGAYIKKEKAKFPGKFKQVNKTETLLPAIFKAYGYKKKLYRRCL